MIVTVTPNPSIDRTVSVDAIARGAINRASSVRVDPGGKGVNVARALTANGHASAAVLPLGGPEGRLMAQLLAEQGVEVVAVPITGTTRANISIVEPDGTTTKINEPGPHLAGPEQDALLAAVHARLDAGAGWVVGSGSLPPGLDADFYARLVTVAHSHGARVAIDTTGAALLAAATAGADLVKPNDDELAAATGTTLTTLGDVVAAARRLLDLGAGQVVVSLGAKGALLVDPHTTLLATSPARVPLSTVGAGDCLLAGYLHAGADAGALATAVRWGAAAVALPGSQVPTPADVAHVDVTVGEPPVSLSLTAFPAPDRSPSARTPQ